jgi:class 3 adenylate cyclase/tetratricopeptide (TPR) repeat protein
VAGSKRICTTRDEVTMTDEMRRIRVAMAALEEQRAVLGDHTIDAALAPLLDRLSVLMGTKPSRKDHEWITVLLVDLVCSTPSTEAIDRGEANQIIAECFERISPLITENGGTVGRYEGDGVMGLFGAPATLEDHQEMAVWTALSMQQALATFNEELEQAKGVCLAMRVGISTGLAMVESLAEDENGRWTATGDTVLVAHRLKTTCPPGRVMISDEAARNLHATFKLEPAQLIVVRDKPRPITGYIVAGKRTKRDRVLHAMEVRAPMIGREGELLALKTSLDRALTDRRWYSVCLIGEAGIGKTRLVQEFIGSTKQTYPQILLLTALSFSHTQATPYAPVADLVRSMFGIAPDADFNTVLGQLTQGLHHLDTNVDEIEFLHWQGSLLNVLGFSPPDDPLKLLDPEQRRDRIFLSLERLLLAVAATTPILLIFEDLHWCDALSLSFVEWLAHLAVQSHTRETSLMLLASSRPAEDPDSSLGRTLDRLSDLVQKTLELQCLDEKHVDALINGLLKATKLPAHIRDLVREHTQGNPFYIEAVLRSLTEDQTLVYDPENGTWQLAREITDIDLPATIQGVLAARLDRLSPDEKQVAQCAAILGRTFWIDLLSEITVGGKDSTGGVRLEDTLSRLEERRLIVPEIDSRTLGDLEWHFSHGLIQEVAYASVTRAVQRRLHQQVARWLEDRIPERSSSLTPIIAYHYEQGEIPRKAIEYLRLAGEQAAAQLANDEAVRHLSRALELLQQTDHDPAWTSEQTYALLLARERVYELLGRRDAQVADLIDLTVLADKMDDDHHRVEVALRHTTYHEAVSDFSAARMSAQRATQWAERAEDVGLEIEGLIAWGRALWRQGAFTDAKSRLETALTLAHDSGNRSAEGTSLHNLGTILYFLGEYRAAQEHLEQALIIRRSLDDQRGEAVSFNNLAGIYHAQGDFAQAKRLTERALAIYQVIGDRRSEIQSLSNLGLIHHALGGLAMARHYYQRALDLFQVVSDRRGEALASKNLGHVLHDLAEYEDARYYCEKALSIDRSTGDRVGTGYSLTYAAMVLEGLGELDQAATSFQEALQLRRTIGQAALAIDDLAGLARVALATSDVTGALNYVEEILGWTDEHGVRSIENPLKVYLTCADVLTAAGQIERTSDILQTAKALLMEQAARISDDRIRQAFLNDVAVHREMIERLAKAEDG